MYRAGFVLLALVLSFATGCKETVTQKIASWQGHNLSQLLASWGAPQQLFVDGNRGRVLAYRFTHSYTIDLGLGIAWVNDDPVAPSTDLRLTPANLRDLWAVSATAWDSARIEHWRTYRLFWVNRHGNVYRWAWRGL
jgi:hypothetical protein